MAKFIFFTFFLIFPIVAFSQSLPTLKLQIVDKKDPTNISVIETGTKIRLKGKNFNLKGRLTAIDSASISINEIQFGLDSIMMILIKRNCYTAGMIMLPVGSITLGVGIVGLMSMAGTVMLVPGITGFALFTTGCILLATERKRYHRKKWYFEIKSIS